MKSKSILNAQPTVELLEHVRASVGAAKNATFNFSVFETKIKQNTYYICLSGGVLSNRKVILTDAGKVALNALTELKTPFDSGRLNFQEVRIGVIPLQKKIKKFLLKLPNYSKVCLFGDMAGELDGVIIDAINLCGATEVITPTIH
jgi:hypothetical protein